MQEMTSAALMGLVTVNRTPALSLPPTPPDQTPTRPSWNEKQRVEKGSLLMPSPGSSPETERITPWRMPPGKFISLVSPPAYSPGSSPTPNRRASFAMPRKRQRAIILLSSVTLLSCFALICTYLTAEAQMKAHLAAAVASIRGRGGNGPCTPAVFDQGYWRLKDNPPKRFKSGEAVLDYVGSPGMVCPFWEEAVVSYGIPTIGIARLTQLMSYEWKTQCSLIAPTVLARLQWLIDNGGLLFVGDSSTRQQFALLGCQLGNAITYRASEGELHEATHDFYLNNMTDIYKHLSFPHQFDPRTTPLATFKRSDLLLSRQELLQKFKRVRAEPEMVFDAALAPKKLHTTDTKQYLDLLGSPRHRYSTVIASTGAFWTLQTLNATSYTDLLDEYDYAMREWIDVMAENLSPHQKLLVRAATPGHGNCSDYIAPLQHEEPVADLFNWRHIPTMNSLMRSIIVDKGSPAIYWMGGERPARLRPDGHNGNDCMHLNIGSGVVEGWIRMIWQTLMTS